MDTPVNAVAFLLRMARVRIEDPAFWNHDGKPGDWMYSKCCAVSAISFADDLGGGAWNRSDEDYHKCFRFLDQAAVEMGEPDTNRYPNTSGLRPAATLKDRGDHARVLEMFDRAIAFAEAG
jgi:hypothetical protein